MLPLSDGMRAREFPWVNVTIIVANFAVWLFYELPDLNGAVAHSSFYACSVDHTCHAPLPWYISWFTAMFMHGSWDHILGNMLFLGIFGKNVEDAFGHLKYLAFYIAGGFAAAALQSAVTILASPESSERIPMLGASGAIAAVMGAFWVLYPDAKITTLVFVFIVRIPAAVYLGGWFLYQFFESNYSLFAPSKAGNGVAFFAHVGGFIFGVLIARFVYGGRRDDVTPSSAATVRPLFW
jgi:membrane associated rhomboid family serine protease